MPDPIPFYDRQQASAWAAENCSQCRKGWPLSDPVCPIEEALTLSYFGDGRVSFDIAQRMTIHERAFTWRCGEFEPALTAQAGTKSY